MNILGLKSRSLASYSLVWGNRHKKQKKNTHTDKKDMKRTHTNWSDNSKHSLWLSRRKKLQIVDSLGELFLFVAYWTMIPIFFPRSRFFVGQIQIFQFNWVAGLWLSRRKKLQIVDSLGELFLFVAYWTMIPIFFPRSRFFVGQIQIFQFNWVAGLHYN